MTVGRTKRGRGFARPSGAAAALLAATGLLVAACGAVPAKHPRPTPSVTARPTPTARATPRATPHAAPTIASGTELDDVSFVSPSRGFALGESCTTAPACRAVLLTTIDGGQTWQPATNPPAAVGPSGVTTATGGAGPTVGRLTFASTADGWAWGPALFATTDGGQSWTRVTTTGPVLALAVVRADVWAVEADCGGAASGGACPLVLESAPLAGGSWAPVVGLPSIDAVAAELVTGGGGDVWLEAVSPGPSQTPSLLLYATTDGGTSWVRRTDPCPLPPPGTPDPLAAYGSTTLWVGCTSQPAAGNQGKAIYTSSDGGITWTLASSSGPAAMGVPAPTGQLTTIGYLDQLALTSPQVGWMALGRGTLLTTRDGGRTWSAAIPIDEVAGGGGIVRVAFVGGSGWAIANQASLPGGITTATVYRTPDGGTTWSPVAVG